MKLTSSEWTLDHLKVHLQAAVDLEFWTIPFYMSAMYSIQDRNSEAYQLIRTVVNQEMLHLQCAANIANSFGLSPTFDPPVYEGTTIPHLDFSKDDPEAIKPYLPYTAEIGPLDLEHINAMCLVEIPDYDTGAPVELHSDVDEYGSIGAFYEALRFGASCLKDEIRGGVRQVDYFSAFYRNMPDMKITESREAGFNQIDLLIDLITDQGEGYAKKDPTVPATFQNTADDTEPEDDHFEKFNQIKNAISKPLTFAIKPVSDYSDEDRELAQIQLESFDALRGALQLLFSGENPENFFPLMAGVGAAIRNCWEHGVTPAFSHSHLVGSDSNDVSYGK
ncbi:ferritin-like domain-containing protein [Pontibacter sp. G13]|uniref:ferritin-like domain-containing protein n=1 Tax=Pontibacter sp. G13 TaxID=3074898 RepID=UPI00288BCD72|nr:ferritin-like domain-containing protein [Pontibacter sp. G13]WNJ17559.1 ferritin-like domain-containing protein [Pontibacter sp. G13]